MWLFFLVLKNEKNYLSRTEKSYLKNHSNIQSLSECVCGVMEWFGGRAPVAVRATRGPIRGQTYVCTYLVLDCSLHLNCLLWANRDEHKQLCKTRQLYVNEALTHTYIHAHTHARTHAQSSARDNISERSMNLW